jgi:hypothetical protein
MDILWYFFQIEITSTNSNLVAGPKIQAIYSYLG